jgi:uncharacterized protein YkwD
MEHGMRRRSISLLTLLLGLLAAAPTTVGAAARPTACGAAHVAIRKATIARADDATLCLLNRLRASRGLPPLRLNRRLAAVAQRHSRDMVRRHYFSHFSLSGASPFQRILSSHYVPRRARSWWLGENIGWGTTSLAQPAALVHEWMHSAPHRANILSPRFHEVGIGIAVGIPLQGGRLAGQPGATYTTDFGSHR